MAAPTLQSSSSGATVDSGGPYLGQLPPDVLSSIVARLTTWDLLSLRQSCRWGRHAFVDHATEVCISVDHTGGWPPLPAPAGWGLGADADGPSAVPKVLGGAVLRSLRRLDVPFCPPVHALPRLQHALPLLLSIAPATLSALAVTLLLPRSGQHTQALTSAAAIAALTAALPRLTSLSLDNLACAGGALLQLSRLQHLTALHVDGRVAGVAQLHGLDLNNERVGCRAELPCVPGLRELHVGRVQWSLGTAEALACMTALTQLVLGGVTDPATDLERFGVDEEEEKAAAAMEDALRWQREFDFGARPLCPALRRLVVLGTCSRGVLQRVAQAAMDSGALRQLSLANPRSVWSARSPLLEESLPPAQQLCAHVRCCTISYTGSLFTLDAWTVLAGAMPQLSRLNLGGVPVPLRGALASEGWAEAARPLLQRLDMLSLTFMAGQLDFVPDISGDDDSDDGGDGGDGGNGGGAVAAPEGLGAALPDAPLLRLAAVLGQHCRRLAVSVTQYQHDCRSYREALPVMLEALSGVPAVTDLQLTILDVLGARRHTQAPRIDLPAVARMRGRWPCLRRLLVEAKDVCAGGIFDTGAGTP